MQTSNIPTLDSKWVRSYLKKHAGEKPVLIAVSGGLDSMVLWDLVHRSTHAYAVAHVNYHLRGEESRLDAKLIEDTAKQRDVTLFMKNDHSLTKESAGLQAQAREIRYDFFRARIDRYPFVCTAHHADDQVETILMQLGRGGGPKALAGIMDCDRGRLRPLLSFSKTELATYAETYNVQFREDQSNAADDYLRNRIRHHLIPLAENTFDGFRQNLSRTAIQQQALLAFAASFIKLKTAQLKSQRWNHALDRSKLAQLPGCSYFMHELLRKHEFSSMAVEAIVSAVADSQVHKRQFLNQNERIRLVLTGQTLHLEQTEPFSTFQIDINAIGEFNSPLGCLTVSQVQGDQATSLLQDSGTETGIGVSEITVASLDHLVWRTTQREDSIQLAKTQSKTAKRVLAEAKRPNLALCASSTLTSNGSLIWIVGLRKSASLQPSEAKTDGYRLRFTTRLEKPGVVSF